MAELSTLNESSPEAGRRAPPAWAYLYVVLDCSAPLAAPSRHGLATTDVVQVGRGEPRAATRLTEDGERRLVLALPDRRMSARHARLLRAGGRWVLEDQQSTNGTRVNGQTVERAELEDGDLLELGRTFFLFRAAQAPGVPDLVAGDEVRTLLPDLEAQYAQLGPLVRNRLPVMVQGEPGVGKELAARLVHAFSGRKGAFVAVNCGGLPADLVAAAFFGARKGAFTGAVEERQGYVSAADQGTLFLDELGELPLAAQATLLRVLQEGEVTPVGAVRPVPVDFQLVTATNRNLAAMVQQGTFRADLLDRLSGFSFALPPLRERQEDLGLLVRAVLAKVPGGPGLTFSPDAARTLLAHAWPGNVRELERALTMAAALAGGKPVELEHLPPTLTSRPTPRPLDGEDLALKERLVEVLRRHHGNISATARELGKARMQVQRWLRRFELDPKDFT